jgi:mono/diheme cytochrome c family protein
MKYFTYLIVGLVLTSCAYNKEESLPAPKIDTTGVQVTYNNYAKQVIDNNCATCHSSSGGQAPFLSNYSEVSGQKNRIEARAINASPSIMPPSGALAQPILDTLQIWLNQGAPQ